MKPSISPPGPKSRAKSAVLTSIALLGIEGIAAGQRRLAEGQHVGAPDGVELARSPPPR